MTQRNYFYMSSVSGQQEDGCRTEDDWSLNFVKDICVIKLKRVSEEDSTRDLATWTCDQGQGTVSVSLTVAKLGSLTWSGDDEDDQKSFQLGDEIRCKNIQNNA